MRGTLFSQDLDRRAASQRAQKRGVDVQNPMRGTPFSEDLDRGDGFETSSKKSCPMRNPVRGTPFSQDLDQGDGFENGAKKAPQVRRSYAWDTVVPGFRSWRRLRKGRITNIIFDIQLLPFG